MKVGVHQGSMLSALIFVVMVDVVMENVINGLMRDLVRG